MANKDELEQLLCKSAWRLVAVKKAEDGGWKESW